MVSYQPNRGKGYAIARGVELTRGDVVMFADAGLCVPFDCARLGLAMLAGGECDVAHGSRRNGGSVVKAQPLYRRLGSRAYRLAVRATMGVPAQLTDTQCGFKLYRGDVARELYAALLTDGYMFDIEIILRALRRGYRIAEFPVRWSNDGDSRYDPVRGTLRNFRELRALRQALANEKKAQTS